jgi:hypothetical protein
MAKKPQGIMSVAPGLVDQIIGADKRKGLGELIGKNTRAYTDDEFYGSNPNNLLSLGAKGSYTDALLRNAFRPIKVASDLVSNVPGALSGIGQYMGQKSDDERQQDAQKIASNMAGLEFGLPTNQTGLDKLVPKGLYDAFDTEDGGQGQKRLVDTQFPDGISIQDVINNADKGTTDGTDGSEIAEEENNITNQTTDTDGSGENLTAAQTATKTALSEFLAQARPGVEPQTYDEYIKEFGDATGLDISGEPDTKQALMSFGLALMQNRAGKGFDISKILTATGEAGEAAMPDFRKAVAESKAVRAKAGEYALGKTKEDQNAAMNRKNYYIVPKGKGGLKGIAANLDKGQFSMLNSYELNNLTNNKEFNEQYEIVPNSTYEKVLTATMKTPEWGEKYLTKYEDIPLFNDAGDDFKIPVQRLNGNYKGPDKPKRGFFNPEKYDDYYGRFKRMDTKINKLSDQLGKAFKISSDGKLNFGGQVADDIKGFAQAFGIGDGGKATDAAEVEYILNSVAAKNSPKILGEAGKTISDNDRLRVEAIIGKMKKTGSPAALRLALQEVYELIVVEGKRDIRQGLSTLNRYSGRKSPNFEKKSLSSEVNEQGVYQVQDK